MYIIREVFIAKPGSAGKLAKMMKAMISADKEMQKGNAKVMLDFVTDYNTIVVEHEANSLAEFEKGMEEYKKNPDSKMAELMKGYTDLYQTGYREIFKVVD